MRDLAALVLVLAVLEGCAGAPGRCPSATVYEGAYAEPLSFEPPTEPSIAPADAALTARFDVAFEDVQARIAATHLTAAVITQDGASWTASSEGAPPRFYWASVGKAFTAMAIFTLVEDGVLSLDDTIELIAPQLEDAEDITLTQLLTHTSGVYSFQLDPSFRAREGHVPPGALVAVAVDHGPRFCPGGAWDYSNTGYVLLGLAIEEAAGAPYHATLNERIFAPLGTTSLEALAPAAIPDDVALPAPSGDDGPRHDLTTPYAAGVVAGNSLEMAIAWRRFLAGGIVPPATVRSMFEPLRPVFDSPVESYGAGVMVYRLVHADPEEHDVWLGHSGGTAGASAIVAYSTGRRAFVAVALTGEGSPEAIALHLLRTLD